jgi:tyrosyl-tRNA synthetase
MWLGCLTKKLRHFSKKKKKLKTKSCAPHFFYCRWKIFTEKKSKFFCPLLTIDQAKKKKFEQEVAHRAFSTGGKKKLGFFLSEIHSRKPRKKKKKKGHSPVRGI